MDHACEIYCTRNGSAQIGADVPLAMTADDGETYEVEAHEIDIGETKYNQIMQAGANQWDTLTRGTLQNTDRLLNLLTQLEAA